MSSSSVSSNETWCLCEGCNMISTKKRTNESHIEKPSIVLLVPLN